jgi:hypothetical protein
MMTRIVSAGEIVKGMIIVAYEHDEIIYETLLTGQLEERKITKRNPWFKGIPYKVCGVAGPIIAVLSEGLQSMPPVVFLDSRIVRFIEVDKKFYRDYLNLMKKNPQSITAAPLTSETQTVFKVN